MADLIRYLINQTSHLRILPLRDSQKLGSCRPVVIAFRSAGVVRAPSLSPRFLFLESVTPSVSRSTSHSGGENQSTRKREWERGDKSKSKSERKSKFGKASPDNITLGNDVANTANEGTL